MSKKTMVIILVLILMIASFTGCSLKSQGEGASSDKKIEEKEDQEEASTEEIQDKIESAIREELSKAS